MELYLELGISYAPTSYSYTQTTDLKREGRENRAKS